MTDRPGSKLRASRPPATLELAADTIRLLRRYLRDRWKDTAALFPTRSSNRITTRSLQRLVEKLAVAADVRPQVDDGGRLEDVQLRLRHANRQTTDQIYSHLVPR